MTETMTPLEQHTAMALSLRDRSCARTLAMLDGMYRAVGMRITDYDSRDLVAGLMDGVQDALATWLPPDHPDRVSK